MDWFKFHQLKINRLAASLTNLSRLSIITPRFPDTTSRTEPAMNASSLSQKEITGMLRAWGGGEQAASEDLIRAVYRELRRQARFALRRERANHTLHTTALINEAYIKLEGQRSVKWKNRDHFFGMAAKLMRRILVDHAKTRHRKKRGGTDEDLMLDDVLKTVAIAAPDENEIDLLALDEALNRLAEIDEQQVRIVELRYFSGLNVPETADILKISPATVKRDWAVAKSWLKHELTRGERQ